MAVKTFRMSNQQLRDAINNTVSQLRPGPFIHPLPAETKTKLEAHLDELLQIERKRAGVTEFED